MNSNILTLQNWLSNKFLKLNWVRLCISFYDFYQRLYTFGRKRRCRGNTQIRENSTLRSTGRRYITKENWLHKLFPFNLSLSRLHTSNFSLISVIDNAHMLISCVWTTSFLWRVLRWQVLSRLHRSKFSLTSSDLKNFICWCVKKNLSSFPCRPVQTSNHCNVSFFFP